MLTGRVTPEVAARQAEMLGNRVKKRLRQSRGRFARRNIEAFRLYDRDIPEVRAAVDWYAGHVVVAEYARTQTEGVPDWLAQMGEGIQRALDLPPERLHLKTRRTQPKAGARYDRMAATERRFSVREGDLSFWVNLDDYIDTGLFADHRKTRARVGAEAAGQRFLNLYGYTGSFTCYAAAGGARSTTTVDQSGTYLDWMRDNLHLNGLDRPVHRAVRSNTEDFLADAARDGRQWSLIVLDPPSRSTVGGPDGRGLDVLRHHRWLVEATLRVLKPGGTLYFSVNHQRFVPDLGRLPVEVEEITDDTIPEDFRPHRPHRTWRMTKRATD